MVFRNKKGIKCCWVKNSVYKIVGTFLLLFIYGSVIYISDIWLWVCIYGLYNKEGLKVNFGCLDVKF